MSSCVYYEAKALPVLGHIGIRDGLGWGRLLNGWSVFFFVFVDFLGFL